MRTLGVRTGTLYRSFGRNHPNSLTVVKKTDTQINAVVGSNLEYANIQNVGGFIEATPKAVKRTTKTGKSYYEKTYKMTQYFWAMYGETKNIFFKRMALSVLKKGGVKIKATKYFDKSLDTYENELLSKQLEKILNLVLKALNGDIDRAIQIAVEALKDVATELPETFQLALSQNMKFRSANNKFNNPKTVTWVNNE